MFHLTIMFAALAAVTSGFTCMTVCRKPLWTCINEGIPGHDIAALQQCVIDDIQAGLWQGETACRECFDQQILTITTEFPTKAPTQQDSTRCEDLRRKKHCEEKPQCVFDEDGGECFTIGAPGVNMTPGPTVVSDIIADMQPCLTYCRDQAMDCAFTHGVDTTCVPCMRECVYDVSFDQSNMSLYKPECGQCIADVFEVIGNPQYPPSAGFALFSDYQRWMATKGLPDTCRDAGGRWKQGNNKNRCVPPKSPKKLRCKKIRNAEVCAAIGCGTNQKKNRCAGAHKWKTAKQKNRGL